MYSFDFESLRQDHRLPSQPLSFGPDGRRDTKIGFDPCSIDKVLKFKPNRF